MEQQTQTTTGIEVAKRPTFLTVLCILSFIFSGIGIILLIIALLGMGALQTAANAAETAGGTYTATGPTMGMLWANVIVGFVTTLIGIFGVVQMWKLKKVGFYIYTACVVISVITGIVTTGFGITSILPLIFVVLYGLNLKAMR